MSEAIETVPDLLDALGGNAAVAKIIGRGPSTVSEMRRSGSINVRYWPPIIDAAQEMGHSEVTSELLMRICIRGRRAVEPQGDGAQC